MIGHLADATNSGRGCDGCVVISPGGIHIGMSMSRTLLVDGEREEDSALMGRIAFGRGRLIRDLLRRPVQHMAGLCLAKSGAP